MFSGDYLRGTAEHAHRIAADTPAQLLPEQVAALVAEHRHTVIRRRTTRRKV